MNQSRLPWRSATRTHVGKVRKLNEDACLESEQTGLWVVADGMGGHSAGDLASQMVVNALSKVSANEQLSTLVEFVEYGILGANNRLYELSKAQNQTSGSTVVALVIKGGYGAFLWAGDSRLYRLRGAELEQLTVDHTQAELYVERGLMSRDMAASHPSGNMVTRAVGATEELFIDIDMAEVMAGDRFLLCTDGLDKHLRFEEIAAAMAGSDPAEIADAMIEETLERGASDNVTVCVVFVEAVS